MILYFDTETTGLCPGHICQLSYLMQDSEKTVAKNFFFTVDFVEPSAYAVHGFSVEKLRELSSGKRFEDFIEEIKLDFESASLIVAHNFNFDFSFMRKEFENAGEVFTYKNSFCSMKKFTPICKLKRTTSPNYKYPKLVELCEFCEVFSYDISRKENEFFGEYSNAHDARYDTTALYLAMNMAKDISIKKVVEENL